MRDVRQVNIFVSFSCPTHPSILGTYLGVKNGVAGIDLFFIRRKLVGILIIPISLRLDLALARDWTDQWFMRIWSRASANPRQLVLA